ncbi:hypothetical protein [Streptomyces sp. UNOB3_S3]|uniref:hypothetical protein n=1 Tax=Streptomyces sp. UNOB3_S3 TaxID=2871682 RepID=UPI001E55D7B5|nr:hypothetical protein [Streptomyces sp. UNOB3_S3]MCC3773741.1 hypothetical protein [Streptomyces sp. UNOB3_S3]
MTASGLDVVAVVTAILFAALNDIARDTVKEGLLTGWKRLRRRLFIQSSDRIPPVTVAVRRRFRRRLERDLRRAGLDAQRAGEIAETAASRLPQRSSREPE